MHELYERLAHIEDDMLPPEWMWRRFVALSKEINAPRSLAKIREALERRSFEFTNGDSPGVRLRPENHSIQ